MFQSDVVRFARKHARQFRDAIALAVQPSCGDRCRSAMLRFLEDVMRVSPRRDLREMRDADHLRLFGKPAQSNADSACGCAADVGIDLVEKERRSPARFGHDHDES